MQTLATVAKIGQMLPLPVKLWLVTNIPLLASINRRIIKQRLRKTEFQRLDKIMAETSAMLRAQPPAKYEHTINLITMSPGLTIKVSGKTVAEQISALIKSQTTRSNAIERALESIASEEYICFLMPGDRFLEGALNYVSIQIENQDRPDIIYWDHTVIDDTGKRIDHHFKPDWSPDYLLCYNYIRRAAMIKKSAIDDEFIQLAKKNWQAAIYNLFVKYAVGEQTLSILRLEEPLQEILNDSKQETAKRLQFELEQTQLKLKNEALASASSKETRKITRSCRDSISSSIIIPTRNGHDILKKCINSVLNSKLTKNDKILIVDNQSNCTKTLAYLESLKKKGIAKVIHYDHPFNYSAINNFAVSQVESEIVVLLNNDIEVISQSWLQDMKAQAIRPEIGCVGATLFYPDGTIQHGGVITGYGGVADHAFKHETTKSNGYMNRLTTDQNLSAVTAACLAIKLSLYEKVGGLNADDLSVAFNDVDLCLKCQATGLRNLWLSNTKLYHHESKSRGIDRTKDQVARFESEINYMKSTWNTDQTVDKYYNKQLSMLSHSFQLKGEI